MEILLNLVNPVRASLDTGRARLYSLPFRATVSEANKATSSWVL
jgi:hypothetical protein